MATKTGWWNPRPMDSRSRFHYRGADGRSLCGKWACVFPDLVNLEEGKDDHADNCAACRKKKLALSKE